jgi:hypothetical protein
MELFPVIVYDHEHVCVTNNLHNIEVSRVCVCVCARACVRVCFFSYPVTVYLPNRQGSSLTFTYCFVLSVRGLSKSPAKRLILSKSFSCLHLGGSHGRDFEKYCMLWCDSVEISFRRKPTAALFRVQVNTEQRGRSFLRNVEPFQSDCMASHPRRE